MTVAGHKRMLRIRWVAGGLAAVGLAGWIVASTSTAAPLVNEREAGYQDATSCSATSATTCVVLAFGDSVAAGYGLGSATGLPDNSSAYPAILAAQLGIGVQDYAVTGACAGPEAQCSTTTTNVAKQISTAVTDTENNGLTPTRITLTVGADDINFAGCILYVIDHESLKNVPDPCGSSELSQHLSTFGTQLTNDLNTLKEKFPNAEIQVMDYYNPFPPPTFSQPTSAPGQTPSSTGAPSPSPGPPPPPLNSCAVTDLFTIRYDAAGFANPKAGLKAAFMKYQSDHLAFENDARTLQATLYSRAQTVLGRLNNVINTSAAGAGVETVSTNDFATHNVCAAAPVWVFAPYLNWSEVIPTPAGNIVYNSGLLAADGNQVCPDPALAIDQKKNYSEQVGIIRFTATSSVNCFPHPTTAGQVAIADDFRQQGG